MVYLCMHAFMGVHGGAACLDSNPFDLSFRRLSRAFITQNAAASTASLYNYSPILPLRLSYMSTLHLQALLSIS